MHLAHVHRLRAIAILAIVAVHAMDYLEWGSNVPGYRLAAEILQGSTLLFFMISGLLFQHLAREADYAGYLVRKLRHVVLPYLVVSLPGVLLLLSRPAFLESHPEFAGTPMWWRAGFLLVYGGSQINQALWFVPVMCLYYVAAPVFWWMLRRPARFWVLPLLLLVALVEHRPEVAKYRNLEVALYYLPAYLLGMWIGLHRERVLAWTDRLAVPVAAAAVMLVVGHLVLTRHNGTYVTVPFSGEQGLVDWIYLQKILVFVLLLALLRRRDDRPMPALDHLADCSFGIYFVHVYVLYALPSGWHVIPGGAFSLLALTTVAFSLSLVLVHAVRRLFGERSRVLIGA